MLQEHVSTHDAQKQVDDLVQAVVGLSLFEVLGHDFEELVALDGDGFGGRLFLVHERLEGLVSAALELLSGLEGVLDHVVHFSLEDQQGVDQLDGALGEALGLDDLVASFDQIRFHVLGHVGKG